MFTDEELRFILALCGDSIALANFISQVEPRSDSLPRINNASIIATKVRGILTEKMNEAKAAKKAEPVEA